MEPVLSDKPCSSYCIITDGTILRKMPESLAKLPLTKRNYITGKYLLLFQNPAGIKRATMEQEQVK